MAVLVAVLVRDSTLIVCKWWCWGSLANMGILAVDHPGIS